MPGLLSNIMRPLGKLWLPPSAEPAFYCACCPETFTATEREKYFDHVVTCGEKHADEMAAKHPHRQAPSFWNAADPEYAAWVASPAGTEWFNRSLER